VFYPGRFSVAQRHALFCSASLPLSKPISATLPFSKAAALPFHEHPLFSAVRDLIDNILIAS